MKMKKHYKTIKIGEKRNIYTVRKINDKEIDITFIELRADEDELNDQEFLEIDDELMNDKVKNAYLTQDIYIIQYKGGEEISTSDGIINKIKEDNSYTLFHTCDTDEGSSGSPIILYNNKVIGVHRGWLPDDDYNRATLLQYPIKEYYKKKEEKKLIYKRKNIINENEKVVIKKYSSKIGNLRNINNDKNTIVDNFNKNIINDKITMIYKINKKVKTIKVLGEEFIKNNKGKCKLIINKKNMKYVNILNMKNIILIKIIVY